MPAPALDHVVVDARDHLDEAEKIYKALGFTLTPRGHHSLGSSNHLAMFGTNYLELLGFGSGGAMRPELELFPVGLNGLVFKTDDADLSFKQAHAAGLQASPVGAFSRPVTIDGRAQDARFRTTHLSPAATGIGRVYFCEHQTPDLVWRPEWQAHANGAREIVGIIVATVDPSRLADLFGRLFGEDAVTRDADGASLD